MVVLEATDIVTRPYGRSCGVAEVKPVRTVSNRDKRF